MCITNSKKDFIFSQDLNKKVLGISGLSQTSLQGTVRWKIEDDEGKVHPFELQAIYKPDSPYRLLSPQQWSQTIKDNDNTGCLTQGDKVILFSRDKNFKRTVLLDDKSNIAIVRTAPGYISYAQFAAECNLDEDICCFNSQEIQDEETDTNNSLKSTEEQQQLVPNYDTEHKGINFKDHEVQETFPVIAQLPEPQQELLRWHYRLGHLPFQKLKELASIGQLPPRLASTTTPMCATCIYGKATRRPWRT
jgi:hypothetical protein